MTSKVKLRCPMCRTEVVVADDFEFRPFCSSRCKKLDLLNWLEGNYNLPRELLPEDLESLPREQQEEVIARALGSSEGRH